MRHINLLLTIFAVALPVANSFAVGSPSNVAPSARTLSTCSHNNKARPVETSLKVAGISEAWSSYQAALESDPLLVKSITASVILSSADCTGQFIEKVTAEDGAEEKQLDLARVARFFLFGLLLQAPWNHFYYLFLDGQIPPTEAPFSQTNIIKIIIDQFIQAPIFTVLIFIFLGTLEGKNSDEIQQKLKNDYPTTIVDNCKSSPTRDLLSFLVVTL